jgi:hypothetical protein
MKLAGAASRRNKPIECGLKDFLARHKSKLRLLTAKNASNFTVKEAPLWLTDSKSIVENIPATRVAP